MLLQKSQRPLRFLAENSPKKAQMAVISPVEAPQATWDLGMAGVARRAAWLPGENAKSRSAAARSVSMCGLEPS